MTAYYNEFDPYAAEWLRNLIKAGHIAPGVVDERSIVDVHPDDLIGFTQCHFFAGLGGWSYALRLAGWPDDRPVWTGSPPCQPFSVAGQQKGKEDDRHLAPVWLNLVSKRLPADLFGEQVAAAVTKDQWLDDLQNHLEAEGYATGASVLPACSVGAPHIRQRIIFCAKRVAHPRSAGLPEQRREWDEPAGLTAADMVSGLADAEHPGLQRRERGGTAGAQRPPGGYGAECGGLSGLADGVDNRQQPSTRGSSSCGSPSAGYDSRGCSSTSGLADAEELGREQCQNGSGGDVRSGAEGMGERAIGGGARRDDTARPGPTNGFWADADWLFCRDGKWRPVEPGTFPLVDGAPAPVGRLRAYGNAIVPQVAAEYIMAYMHIEHSFDLV